MVRAPTSLPSTHLQRLKAVVRQRRCLSFPHTHHIANGRIGRRLTSLCSARSITRAGRRRFLHALAATAAIPTAGKISERSLAIHGTSSTAPGAASRGPMSMSMSMCVGCDRGYSPLALVLCVASHSLSQWKKNSRVVSYQREYIHI